MTDVTYEEVLRDPYRLEPLIAQLDPSIPLQAAKINHARHFSRIGGVNPVRLVGCFVIVVADASLI